MGAFVDAGVLNFSIPKKLVYLACPYTHENRWVMVARFEAANIVSAKLMADGEYIFSPISHTHPIAEASKYNKISLPRGWGYWQEYDRSILRKCGKVKVLCLPEWQYSKGVQDEIQIGNDFGIPIEYLDYDFIPTFDELVEMAKRMEKVAVPNDKKHEYNFSIDGGNYSGTANVCFSQTYDEMGDPGY